MNQSDTKFKNFFVRLFPVLKKLRKNKTKTNKRNLYHENPYKCHTNNEKQCISSIGSINCRAIDNLSLFLSGRFSGVTVTFTFQRRTMYYIFQMYIPCICIVALSWVSFWVDAEAVPARVGLSITTVLTICYMLGSVNSNLPRVSYLKAIDYFLLLSFGFIFLTLVEYVVVLKYTRRKKYSGSFSPPKCKTALLEDEWVSGCGHHVLMNISLRKPKRIYIQFCVITCEHGI